MSNTTIFPKTTDFQWNFAYILTFWSTNLGGDWCYTRNSRSTSSTINTSNTFNTSDIRNTSNTINTSNVNLPTGQAHLWVDFRVIFFPLCTLCIIHDLLLLSVTKLLQVRKIYIFILLPCVDLLSHGKGLFRILLRLNLIGSCEWSQIFTFSRLTSSSSSSIQQCHFMAHLEHFVGIWKRTRK